MVEVTTVGPLSYETRDEFRDYKEQAGHRNYDAALSALLEEVSTER